MRPRDSWIVDRDRHVGAIRPWALGENTRTSSDLVHDRSSAGQITGFNFRLRQHQQQVGVAVNVDVDPALLLRLPTNGRLGAAALFVDDFLGHVETGVHHLPYPRIAEEPPILVRDAITADRPIKPRIHRRHIAGDEVGVIRIPVSRIRYRERKSRHGVNLELVDQVLRRWVKAAASEVTRRIREIQTLTIVRIRRVRLSVVGRCLVREDRLWAVRRVLISAPDTIEARFEPIRTASLDLLELRNRGRPLMRVGKDAAPIGLGGPLIRATYLSVARRRRQKLDRRVEVFQDLRGNRRAIDVRLAKILVVLAVVGHVPPHPVCLEVVVRPEEYRLPRDLVCLRGRVLRRARRYYLLQQAKSRVRSDDSLIHYYQLLIQILVCRGSTPMISLDVIDGGLIGTG